MRSSAKEAFIQILAPIPGQGLNSVVAEWSKNLDTSLRFTLPGGPNGFYGYMQNHQETVREHIDMMLVYTENLFRQHPELHKVFDLPYIQAITSCHEAEEIPNGDISLEVQYANTGLSKIGTIEAQEAEDYKLKIAEIVTPLFPENRELIDEVSKVIDKFDHWENCDAYDHDILFARLLDVIAGNQSVIDWANDLNDPDYSSRVSFMTSTRVNSVMKKLATTKAMKEHPYIFAIIENIILKQNEQWKDRGVNIVYTPYCLLSYSNLLSSDLVNPLGDYYSQLTDIGF